MALFCGSAVLFLVVRDLLLPEVREVEIWLGFEIHGWLALASAPLHWAIFVVGAWGFWQLRPWIWPWASLYAFYVALSHFIWNQTSPSGAGIAAGLLQFALLSIPAVCLLLAKPAADARHPQSS